MVLLVDQGADSSDPQFPLVAVSNSVVREKARVDEIECPGWGSQRVDVGVNWEVGCEREKVRAVSATGRLYRERDQAVSGGPQGPGIRATS